MGLKTLMSADAPFYIKCLFAPPTAFTTTLPLPFFLNTWIFFFFFLTSPKDTIGCEVNYGRPNWCQGLSLQPRYMPFGMRVNALTAVKPARATPALLWYYFVDLFIVSIPT